MNSIRPAEAVKVEIKDEKSKHAIIVVPDAQLSLAIGKEGQNARLSSKLTGWTLDIRGEDEYKAHRLEIKDERTGGKKSETKDQKSVTAELITSEKELLSVKSAALIVSQKENYERVQPREENVTETAIAANCSLPTAYCYVWNSRIRRKQTGGAVDYRWPAQTRVPRL